MGGSSGTEYGCTTARRALLLLYGLASTSCFRPAYEAGATIRAVALLSEGASSMLIGIWRTRISVFCFYHSRWRYDVCISGLYRKACLGEAQFAVATYEGRGVYRIQPDCVLDGIDWHFTVYSRTSQSLSHHSCVSAISQRPKNGESRPVKLGYR